MLSQKALHYLMKAGLIIKGGSEEEQEFSVLLGSDILQIWEKQSVPREQVLRPWAGKADVRDTSPGCLFSEQGVAPPAWLKGFDFTQKNVSKCPRCQGLQWLSLGKEGCKN